jgi:hypothetical protein
MAELNKHKLAGCTCLTQNERISLENVLMFATTYLEDVSKKHEKDKDGFLYKAASKNMFHLSQIKTKIENVPECDKDTPDYLIY